MGTILRQSLVSASRGLDGDKFLEFGNPDTLGLQVRRMPAGSYFGHVHANSPLFLRETATMNLAAPLGARSGNVTFSSHGNFGKAQTVEPIT